MLTAHNRSINYKYFIFDIPPITVMLLINNVCKTNSVLLRPLRSIIKVYCNSNSTLIMTDCYVKQMNEFPPWHLIYNLLCHINFQPIQIILRAHYSPLGLKLGYTPRNGLGSNDTIAHSSYGKRIYCCTADEQSFMNWLINVYYIMWCILWNWVYWV